MSVIRNFIDKPVIKVLTGMRRCGKSSLLILTYEEILKRKCVDEKNILYFNFESLEYESLKDYKALYKYIREIIDKSAGSAINQIKEKNYLQFFKDYKGEVQLVGINFSKDTKTHQCIIEKVMNR